MSVGFKCVCVRTYVRACVCVHACVRACVCIRGRVPHLKLLPMFIEVCVPDVVLFQSLGYQLQHINPLKQHSTASNRSQNYGTVPMSDAQ